MRLARELRLALVVPVLWAVDAAAVVGDVNQPDVCYLCHDTVEAQQELRHVHTAFSDGNCSNCHNPHASKHAALLADDERALCASCHDDVAGPGLAAPHPPAARGECISCHDPHASNQPAQLELPLVDQCTSCHAAVDDWMARANLHAPVGAGDCVSCHDPHGGQYAALLPGGVTETCLGCHEPDAAMTAAHKSPAIADANCTACHDPHSSNRKSLLRENEHGPFASGNCATCHGKIEGRESFEVAGVRDLCERCHQATRQFADFTYHHNLDAPESCVQCHNPHASNVESLLLGPTPDLCGGCHFNEPTREKPRAEYITHDGIECTACHQPHGAVNARYLRTEGVELCAGCHSEAHAVSHPVGPEVIDPRTEQSVTCLSCHQLHGSDFEKYLPLDPTRDLCLQCHRR